MTPCEELPFLEISCRTCSRNKSTPVCISVHTYCGISGKQTSGSWLPGQPRPDEPCDKYNPSRSSIIGTIIDWRMKRQELKSEETQR